MKVELINCTENPIETMAIAGSNCYDSSPTKGLVMHCLNSGHHSIMEFVDFHFKISGVSRSLMSQLTRHRHASFAIRSQRYCREDGFEVVMPKGMDANKKYYASTGKMGLALSCNDILRLIQGVYSEMIKDGVAAEDARSILPNATCTVIDVKMNLRSLMNFMNLRLCTRSQSEIRQLANEMKNIIISKYPELEPFLRAKCEVNGFCTEGKSCGRFPTIKEFKGGQNE